MRTLLEKAKPELLAALNAQMDEYPVLAEATVDHLEKRCYVNEMTIQYWVEVKSLWMQVTGELINHPWDFFED